MQRTLISSTYKDSIPDRGKILAVDGVVGVVIMLAYWGGDNNRFPENVKPEFYVESKDPNGVIKIDIENLTALIEQLSIVIGREIGQLSVSSLKPLRMSLKRGKRHNAKQNGYGKVPPVHTEWRSADQMLTIVPRGFEMDQEAGLLSGLHADLVELLKI